MPYIDGLPAGTPARSDLTVLCQNSTGTPGSGTDAKATLAALFASLTHNDISDWATATSGFFGAPGAPGPISPGGLGGLTLSNDQATFNTVIDVSAGSCADSTNAVTITLAAFTKSISGPWVAGTGAIGMGTGVIAALNTWYHVFAAVISGAADVFIDSSATATNAPAGTTAFRRIGSIKLDASVHIRAFSQIADRFDWATPVLEVTGTPGVTTAVTKSLIGVPPGVPVAALLSGAVADATSPQNSLYISSLAQADVVPGGTVGLTAISGPTVSGTTSFYTSVMTNTSAQIRTRVTSTTLTLNVISNGWIDTRGRG
jgi:hypothetical protein